MTELDRAVRLRREARLAGTEVAVKVETEIFPDARAGKIGTVFLRNGECPLACVYCGLYRHATDRPATGEEIAAQIREGRRKMPRISGIKLYNASSLFERNSIRQTDDDLSSIAREVEDLDLVVVEARSENAFRAGDLAHKISGTLEVAIGLEVADDELLALLNKPSTVGRFVDAARILRGLGIRLRAFVLVQPPFVATADARALARKTVELASREGARVVSLLPVVSSHAPMEALRRADLFSEISLDDYYDVVLDSSRIGPLIIAETESLARLGGCPNCRNMKIARLESLNATGEISAVSCSDHRPIGEFRLERPTVGRVVDAFSSRQ